MFKRDWLDRYRIWEEYPGGYIEKHKVKAISSYNNGWGMLYQVEPGVCDVVYVPRMYKFKRYEGKECILKSSGNSSAGYIVSGDKDIGGDDLFALVDSDIATRGLKTLYAETKIPKWLVIGVIILIIAGIGMFTFNKIINSGEQGVRTDEQGQLIIPQEEIMK